MSIAEVEWVGSQIQGCEIIKVAESNLHGDDGDDGYSYASVSPCHVAIAVEGVRYQIQGGEGREFVESSRGDAADLVPKQAQALQVVQALQHCKSSVDFETRAQVMFTEVVLKTECEKLP